MRNSTILCPVKMEYGPEINIFVLKMIMKRSLEKLFLKFLDVQAIFRIIDLLHKVEDLCIEFQIHYLMKKTFFSQEGISMNFNCL